MSRDNSVVGLQVPRDISDTIDDLHDEVLQLHKSHRTLARLTKQSYQHSQQTWSKLVVVEHKIDMLTKAVTELTKVISMS